MQPFKQSHLLCSWAPIQSVIGIKMVCSPSASPAAMRSLTIANTPLWSLFASRTFARPSRRADHHAQRLGHSTLAALNHEIDDVRGIAPARSRYSIRTEVRLL